MKNGCCRFGGFDVEAESLNQKLYPNMPKT